MPGKTPEELTIVLPVLVDIVDGDEYGEISFNPRLSGGARSDLILSALRWVGGARQIQEGYRTKRTGLAPPSELGRSAARYSVCFIHLRLPPTLMVFSADYHIRGLLLQLRPL